MTNWRYLFSMGDLSAKEMAYELSQNTDNAKCRFCEFAFEYEKCPGTAEPEVCEEHIYRWLRRRRVEAAQA